MCTRMHITAARFLPWATAMDHCSGSTDCCALLRTVATPGGSRAAAAQEGRTGEREKRKNRRECSEQEDDQQRELHEKHVTTAKNINNE